MSHVTLFHILHLAVAVLLFHHAMSQGFVACPPGCTTKMCPRYVGCSVCKNGFCLHVNEATSEGECITSCPDMFFCERIFLSVCKVVCGVFAQNYPNFYYTCPKRACKDSDCEVCDSSGLCKTCLPGFVLSPTTHVCTTSNTSTAASVDLSQTIG